MTNPQLPDNLDDQIIGKIKELLAARGLDANDVKVSHLSFTTDRGKPTVPPHRLPELSGPFLAMIAKMIKAASDWFDGDEDYEMGPFPMDSLVRILMSHRIAGDVIDGKNVPPKFRGLITLHSSLMMGYLIGWLAATGQLPVKIEPPPTTK